MKISNLRRIIPSEFPRNPNKWLELLGDILNNHLEEITTCLQGRVSAENENADRLEIEALHGVPTAFRFNVKGGHVDEVRILWSESAVDSWHWDTTAEGKAVITVSFVGAPTAAQTLRLLVRGL
ncbi:MAG: hypothetical protein JW940_21580 [Polyangiaceae bacterium]|nr:hypothetical protein [Polyangiaceae bacterium]